MGVISALIEWYVLTSIFSCGEVLSKRSDRRRGHNERNRTEQIKIDQRRAGQKKRSKGFRQLTVTDRMQLRRSPKQQ
jgi:hypothetical protein